MSFSILHAVILLIKASFVASRRTHLERHYVSNDPDDIISQVQNETVKIIPLVVESTSRTIQQSNDQNNISRRTSVQEWWDHNYFINSYYTFTVYIDSQYSSAEKKLIESSIQDLVSRSKVIRVNFPNKKPTKKPFLYVYPDTGCWSYIGRSSLAENGGQTISLGKGCVTKGTIQHEFLHAMGYYHEHNRLDRDKYVTIHPENILSARKKSFVISTDMNTYGVPYDLNSVMHYSSRAASKNGRPTITVNDKNSVIGSGEEASFFDILRLRLMYQCKTGPRNWNALKNDETACTMDCTCWKGQSGCGHDGDKYRDHRCKGNLICLNNVCTTKPPGVKKPVPKVRSLVKYSITTSYYVNGYVFDITAKNKKIKISNFLIWLTKRDKPYKIEIYTREGSHVGRGYNKNDWTKISINTLSVVGKGDWVPRHLPRGSMIPQVIEKKSKRAFYIMIAEETYAFLAPERSAFNNKKWLDNKHATIKEGCVLDYNFNNDWEECRSTSGGVSYNFLGGFDYNVMKN